MPGRSGCHGGDGGVGIKGELIMRRTHAAGIAVLVGATAAWVVPTAAVAAPPDIRVTARETSAVYTDGGRPGESPGDSFAFTDRLMKNGERVGRDVVNCDVVRASRRLFVLQCVGTLTFKGRGDLTVQGKLEYTNNGDDRNTLAITGGTGEFRGASGEFEVVDDGGPTRYRIFLDPV